MVCTIPYQPNSLLILCRVTIVQYQGDCDLLQHATEFFQTILLISGSNMLDLTFTRNYDTCGPSRELTSIPSFIARVIAATSPATILLKNPARDAIS